MPEQASTLDAADSGLHLEAAGEALVPALILAWAAGEPHRAGEIALVEPGAGALVLGRGDSGSGQRLWFHRQRPGVLDRTPPLTSPGLSREQLRVRGDSGRLRLDRVGKCPMEVGGVRVDTAHVEPGDTVLLRGQLLLFCARRPRLTPPLRSARIDPSHAFGAPDAHGIVGESPVVWRLRDQLAWLGQVDQHTLVLGPSGSGKELCARAVHSLSARARGPFVARNAATIPHGIADAELFGNLKNYPNPGMPERPGLVGAADGGTLFLDEIGELPQSLQASLLRVLDEGGEYHRLGSTVASRSRLRLLGATNRDPSALKHDLAARLVLRLTVPGLDERREDIPLLIRHLLRRAAEKSPEATRRFRVSPDSLDLRPGAALVRRLSTLSYTTNLRELDALLWRAMSASEGGVIEWPEADPLESPKAPRLSPDTPSRGPDTPSANSDPSRRPDVPEPTEPEIRRALEDHAGNVVRTAHALGLTSRYVLYRLMRRYGIES